MSVTMQAMCSGPPPFALSEKDVVELADELVAYQQHFAGLFFRKEQRRWALKYLQGLLLPSEGKCIEKVALSVEDGKVRPMQRFIGEGAWEDGPILAKHRQLVAESLGDEAGVLIVDGTEFPKKGKHSVGVARQWCGIRGKIDNCQAAVFVAYASERGRTLLDRRLYLPQEWFEPSARERWRGCAIPEGTDFRTKPELAWEMIQAVKEGGALPFSWVTCDESFGNNHQFLAGLERAQMCYLADVPISTLVWLERPETEIPPSKGRGRRPSRERLAPGAPQPIRVDELATQLPKGAWRKHRVKDGEKGPIQARFAFVRAVAVRDKLPGPDVWVVFRRSLGASPELKVFISNAPADTPRRELVRVSGMRWPIETCFEEAKGELGMAEYQTRSWRGWHHHMTLVILAHHFLVRLKLKHKKGRRR
ncbi:MAG: IS701 family transposase [Dehalococcoidia bacterium]